MQRVTGRNTLIVPGIWLLIAACCVAPVNAEAKGSVDAEQASVKNPETRILDQVTLPKIDLDQDTGRQVVVDREAGQYLGHVTTVLLEEESIGDKPCGRFLVFRSYN